MLAVSGLGETAFGANEAKGRRSASRETVDSRVVVVENGGASVETGASSILTRGPVCLRPSFGARVANGVAVSVRRAAFSGRSVDMFVWGSRSMGRPSRARSP